MSILMKRTGRIRAESRKMDAGCTARLLKVYHLLIVINLRIVNILKESIIHMIGFNNFPLPASLFLSFKPFLQIK